jgi:hypothetical protein
MLPTSGNGGFMSTIIHPPKQAVRAWLEQRKRAGSPPPTPEEIRRQLGWGMMMPDFKLAPVQR